MTCICRYAPACAPHGHRAADSSAGVGCYSHAHPIISVLETAIASDINDAYEDGFEAGYQRGLEMAAMSDREETVPHG